MSDPGFLPTCPPEAPLAVLTSGGLDSAILVGEAARSRPVVHPIYIRFGLLWESIELQVLRHFLTSIRAPSLRSLVLLDLPARDLYGEHWSLSGRGVPDADSPDEAVELPGRNVLLLSKAMLWCHLHDVPALALGLLGGNPFPDATPEFFNAYQDTVNRAIGGSVRLYRPYATLSKTAVLHRGRGLPLQWTFSCIRPVNGKHCGTCNKCAERRRGFAAAGMHDPTHYQEGSTCIE